MSASRRLKLHRILHADSTDSNGSYNTFRPVLDGKIIPARPTPSILSGQFAKVPLIVGCVPLPYSPPSWNSLTVWEYSATSNETVSSGDDLDSALQAFFPGLTQNDLTQYNDVYAVSNFDNSSQQVRVAAGESGLRCAVRCFMSHTARVERLTDVVYLCRQRLWAGQPHFRSRIRLCTGTTRPTQRAATLLWSTRLKIG